MRNKSIVQRRSGAAKRFRGRLANLTGSTPARRKSHHRASAAAAIPLRLRAGKDLTMPARLAAQGASATETAVILMIPRAVADGVRMWAGFAAPRRIGPTISASAIIIVMV